MSAAKFWNGSSWQTVVAVQGPPGPQGPPGAPGSPTTPSVGNQHIVGADPTVSGNVTNASAVDAFWAARGGIVIDGKADGSQPLMLAAITPTYNCWWPISAVALVRVLDATWYGVNVAVVLSDANGLMRTDADGYQQKMVRANHHNAAGDWASGTVACQFKLVAGQTYRAQLTLNQMTGGTWNYYRGGNVHSWIGSPGVVPR
jgi:hypothetical protein